MRDTITIISQRILTNKIYEFVNIKSYAYEVCLLDTKKMNKERLKYNIKLKERTNIKHIPAGQYNYIKKTGEFYNAYQREPVLVIYLFSHCRQAVCMTTNKKLILIRYSDIVLNKSNY